MLSCIAAETFRRIPQYASRRKVNIKVDWGIDVLGALLAKSLAIGLLLKVTILER